MNLLVPIYDKHWTDEDVKGLILFYETPLGQKMITVLPQVMIWCSFTAAGGPGSLERFDIQTTTFRPRPRPKPMPSPP